MTGTKQVTIEVDPEQLKKARRGLILIHLAASDKLQERALVKLDTDDDIMMLFNDLADDEGFSSSPVGIAIDTIQDLLNVSED